MKQPPYPHISIIIPTYARPRQLAACLAALSELDYPRERFEVIVVNDGGDTSLSEMAPFRQQINVTLITQPNAGPATARNTGAAQAKGEFLAFTDDDCAPARDWLQALANRFATTPDQLIGGRTLNALDENLCSTACQLLIDYLYGYYNSVPGEARFLTSNNMAMSAELFHSTGGFNTSFPLAAGEDRELCDRWLAGGYRMTYAPEVVINHAHHLTLRRFWGQHFNYGRSAIQFHRARAQRSGEAVKVEPASFYLNLLRYPCMHARAWRKPLLLMLFAISQAANTAGFFYERGR